MSIQDLSIEEIRPLVMEALKNFHTGVSSSSTNLQTITLWHEVGRVSIQKGVKDAHGVSDPNWGRVLSKKESHRLGEIITNLFTEGVLMWKLDPSTSSGAPFMDITEYGEKVLEEGEITPHDPDGFIKLFKEEVPQANELVEKYLIESVQTYRHSNLFSSSVMLGIAAEASFDDLYDSLEKSLTDPNRKNKFEKLDKRANLKEKFDEVMKQIRDLKPILDQPLNEIIESHVHGIFELIRLQRNDFAHPTYKRVSRTDLFVLMRLFRSYVKSSYLLKEWLDQNSGWEGQLKQQSG